MAVQRDSVFLKVEKQVDPQWEGINSYDNPADMDFQHQYFHFNHVSPLRSLIFFQDPWFSLIFLIKSKIFSREHKPNL